MAKRVVLDVGNCGPDHASIRRLLVQNFEVDVMQSHGPEDTLAALRSQAIDLVLINRKLDQDYSDGTEILKLIKADAELSPVPVMIITNHDEYQQSAMALGAVLGFGKLALGSPQTKQVLAEHLATP